MHHYLQLHNKTFLDYRMMQLTCCKRRKQILISKLHVWEYNRMKQMALPSTFPPLMLRNETKFCKPFLAKEERTCLLKAFELFFTWIWFEIVFTFTTTSSCLKQFRNHLYNSEVLCSVLWTVWTIHGITNYAYIYLYP